MKRSIHSAGWRRCCCRRPYSRSPSRSVRAVIVAYATGGVSDIRAACLRHACRRPWPAVVVENRAGAAA